VIVGIFTLISLLLFGDAQQYFFVENLEKGVKEYVVDKERSNEIKMLLKEVKDETKSFNKVRKKQLKELRSMNLNVELERNDFTELFDQLAEKRSEYQRKVISQRIHAVEKIENEEWQNIIDYSNAALDKQIAKAEKKKKKNEKDAFASVEKTIIKSLTNTDNQNAALSALNKLKSDLNDMNQGFLDINTKENKVLINKSASLSDGMAISEEMNSLRAKAWNSMLDFRFTLKDIAEEDQWIKIMKSLNKAVL
jgi:hypothetical protein